MHVGPESAGWFYMQTYYRSAWLSVKLLTETRRSVSISVSLEWSIGVPDSIFHPVALRSIVLDSEIE